MPYLILLVLVLAYVQNKWPEPPAWLTPLGSVLVTWLAVILFVALAGIIVRHFCRRLRQAPARAGLLRRYLLFRRVHTLGLLAVYLLVLYAAGWGWTVKHCLTYGKWSLPGAELLILLPFLSAVFLSWARFYDAELAVQGLAVEEGKEALVSRWTYVGLQARQSLLLAAPPFVLLLVQQVLVSLFPQVAEDDLLMPILSGVLLALLFVGQALLLRVLLNLKPLPPGPLRERLEQTARRLHFHHADILVWDTHDTLATALLSGPVPLFRYVVLSDRLIHYMDEEEVEAVFGHEVGHVKHHHMFFYLGFLIASLLILTAVWHLAVEQISQEQLAAWLQTWTPWLPSPDVLLLFPMLFLLTLYIFIVFGWLSRQCERQADLYACRAVSYPAFLSALEKVAWLNGMSRDRPGWLSSWRHGTIAQRIDFLLATVASPRLAQRFQHETGWLKWGLLLGLASVVLLIGPERMWEILRQL